MEFLVSSRVDGIDLIAQQIVRLGLTGRRTVPAAVLAHDVEFRTPFQGVKREVGVQRDARLVVRLQVVIDSFEFGELGVTKTRLVIGRDVAQNLAHRRRLVAGEGHRGHGAVGQDHFGRLGGHGGTGGAGGTANVSPGFGFFEVDQTQDGKAIFGDDFVGFQTGHLVLDGAVVVGQKKAVGVDVGLEFGLAFVTGVFPANVTYDLSDGDGGADADLDPLDGVQRGRHGVDDGHLLAFFIVGFQSGIFGEGVFGGFGVQVQQRREGRFGGDLGRRGLHLFGRKQGFQFVLGRRRFKRLPGHDFDSGSVFLVSFHFLQLDLRVASRTVKRSTGLPDLERPGSQRLVVVVTLRLGHGWQFIAQSLGHGCLVAGIRFSRIKD